MKAYIIDIIQDRALKLINKLNDLGCSFKNDSDYQGAIKKDEIEYLVKKLAGYDVLFVHSNNTNINNLIPLLKDSGIFIVAYSGGGISQFAYSSQNNVGVFKGVFEVNNYIEFFENVDKLFGLLSTFKSREDMFIEFKKLFGYDHILEVKLQLLHELLVNDIEIELKKERVEDYQLVKDIVINESSVNKEQTLTVEGFLTQSFFSNHFVNLITLREALFAEG